MLCETETWLVFDGYRCVAKHEAPLPFPPQSLEVPLSAPRRVRRLIATSKLSLNQLWHWNQKRAPDGDVSQTCEGHQDETNWVYVRGWAWDSRQPNDPVQVEVYDGDRRLATVTADVFREDLRLVGKGNGRHGFFCPLTSHLHDRRKHRITVRIAHSGMVLPGGSSTPITRRTRPPPVPYFSQPPYILWFYYTVLKAVFRPFPHPVWRVPALLLGTLRAWSDAERRLSRALLEALGMPTTPFHRWRMQWVRSYCDQAETVLLPQASRYTRDWVRRQIDCTGVTLPPGGAVLIAPHCAMGVTGFLALATLVDHLVLVSQDPRHPDLQQLEDETQRLHWQHTRMAQERVVPMTVLTREEAGRTGLRLLRDGASLILFADAFRADGPTHRLLGRDVSVSRGAAWFAQRSGKPLIPWMVVPHRFGWRLWIGDPLPPTEEGLIRGLETCIRIAPQCWWRTLGMTWLESPKSDE
jgi:hypothetical protein